MRRDAMEAAHEQECEPRSGAGASHQFRYKVRGLETSHERCTCGHQHGTHDRQAGCTYGSRRNGICQCERFRRQA